MGGRGNAGARNSSLRLTTQDEIDDIIMDLNDDDFKRNVKARGDRYFGGDYGRDLNAYIAGNQDLSLEEMRPDYAGTIQRLDNSMVSISKSIISERYVDKVTLPGFNANHPEKMVGKTITTPGYLSTTIDAKNSDFEFSNYPAKVIITAPPGTKAILGGNRKEAEVLYHRNSSYTISRYEVSKNSVGDPQIVYYATLNRRKR